MQVRDRERGSQIADYRIEAVLGRGGMSVVYLAEDLRLKRRVALKLLTPALAEDERFRDRFLRESELAASLDHPNVIPIYEAGEADGSLFIAMRYVEGSDLKALLRDGPLSQERAVLLTGQVAAALDAAHERGLVHGDVKPSNVLIDGRGHAYLADFGLTKRVTDEHLPAGEAQLMGTIDYVSPEQIRGEEVDGRADVYSLGCLLYECLTGRQPFKRGNDAAILYAHLEDEPPATDTAADPVLTRALAKSPGDRYKTCGELAQAARQALGVAAPRRSRSPLAIAVLVVAAGVASFLTVFFLRGGGPNSPPLTGRLLRIDAAKGRPADSLRIGGDPVGIAAAGGHIWVSTLARPNLWRVDSRTLTASSVATAGNPTGIAVDGGVTYVANDTGGVERVDASGSALGGVPPTGGADAIASGPAGVWVANNHAALRLQSESRTVGLIIARVHLHLPSTNETSGFEATGVAVGKGVVWVVGDAVERRLWRIDPRSRRVVATIRLPFAPSSVAVGFGSVWVTAQLDDSVARVDPVRNRIVRLIKVGREPSGVAAGAGAIWVANELDRTLSRVDPATDRVAETIPLGLSPRWLVVSGSSVWVAADEH